MMEDDTEEYPDSLAAGVLSHVLGCVYQCLLHDTDGALVTEDVFNILMQPLLDQVCCCLRLKFGVFVLWEKLQYAVKRM